MVEDGTGGVGALMLGNGGGDVVEVVEQGLQRLMGYVIASQRHLGGGIDGVVETEFLHGRRSYRAGVGEGGMLDAFNNARFDPTPPAHGRNLPSWTGLV